MLLPVTWSINTKCTELVNKSRNSCLVVRLRTTAGGKRDTATTVCVCRLAHRHTHGLSGVAGRWGGFGTHMTSPACASACFTHFALRPGGGGGEWRRGHGFFGLTEEAILLTSDPHWGDVLGFSALPGTQCVPWQRLPVRYRNKKQPANKRAAQWCVVSLAGDAKWQSGHDSLRTLCGYQVVGQFAITFVWYVAWHEYLLYINFSNFYWLVAFSLHLYTIVAADILTS